MKLVGIIDYGSGNFASVLNAVQSITSNVRIIKTEKEFDSCTHIILPGVGAYKSAMSKLTNMNILSKLEDEIMNKGKQFLGICVGMQILVDEGWEFEHSEGLSYIPGISTQIDVNKDHYPLPHMGWNTITDRHNSPLFKDMDDDVSFYFLHSYEVILHSDKIKPVVTEYGKKIVAAFSRNNLHGVQFHPEKSQHYGLKLLENFFALSC